MTPKEILNDLENHSINLDWKCPIDDAVLAMADQWKQWEHVFNNEKVKSLVENYNAEIGNVYLPALGQELSVYNLALYCILKEDEDYCLVVIDSKSIEKFEQTAKSQKIDVELQKQARKKLGSPATRLILADQIPYDRYPIAKRAMVEFSYPLSLQFIASDTGNSFLDATRSIIDLRDFPPRIHPTTKISRIKHNKDLDLWGAVFFNNSGGVSIKVGKDILDTSNWKEVAGPLQKIDILSNLYWVQSDLLVLHEETAWFISSAVNENATCEKILQVKKTDKYLWTTYPKLIKTLNGNVYVLVYFHLYLLKEKKLEPTGISFPENSLSDYFPTGNFRFAYVSKKKLVEVDILKQKTRFRTLPYQDNSNSIRQFFNEWAVFTRFGPTDKDLDIIQFWNTKTDTWHHIKLGAFGKHGISNITLSNEGDAIFNSPEMLFRVKDFMAKLNDFEKFTVESWSEDWLPEAATSDKKFFFDKLKSIFTR
uniref:hypothetical protein n=2 Tax=Flavobacterium sp. TaxID=239 RepID=UPI0040499952